VINPTFQPTYTELSKIYGKETEDASEEIKEVLDQDIQSNSLIMSFWYKHYNKIEKSFAYFMQWIQ
jgi:hypothetical protein